MSNPTSSLSYRRTQIPKTREIAAIGLFGALTIILSVISNYVLKIAFPPVNYLLFDMGEIPTILCFFIIGPRGGISVAAVEWLALNLLPSSSPLIGPLFKLLSVAATIAGIWVGWKLAKTSNWNLKFGTSSVTGAISRAAIMTPFNAILLVLSFSLAPSSQAFYTILELTAIFNVLHTAFDMIPTYIVLRLPQVDHILRKNGMTWFDPRITRRSR